MIFSPVAKLTSIRFLLSIVATFDLEVEQMDVKTLFLHGDLEEEIYMKQPKGFIVKGNNELVCKLTSVDPNPRLYQAPRGIKSPEVQTSSQVLHSRRFAAREI